MLSQGTVKVHSPLCRPIQTYMLSQDTVKVHSAGPFNLHVIAGYSQSPLCRPIQLAGCHRVQPSPLCRPIQLAGCHRVQSKSTLQTHSANRLSQGTTKSTLQTHWASRLSQGTIKVHSADPYSADIFNLQAVTGYNHSPLCRPIELAGCHRVQSKSTLQTHSTSRLSQGIIKVYSADPFNLQAVTGYNQSPLCRPIQIVGCHRVQSKSTLQTQTHSTSRLSQGAIKVHSACPFNLQVVTEYSQSGLWLVLDFALCYVSINFCTY